MWGSYPIDIRLPIFCSFDFILTIHLQILAQIFIFYPVVFYMQVLIEAGQDFVKIQEVNAADGEPDLLISMDESKIDSVGMPAIGAFLRKLQVSWKEGLYLFIIEVIFLMNKLFFYRKNVQNLQDWYSPEDSFVYCDSNLWPKINKFCLWLH